MGAYINPKVVWTKWAVHRNGDAGLSMGGFTTAREAKSFLDQNYPGGYIVRCRGPQSDLWARRYFWQHDKRGQKVRGDAQ